MLSLICQISVSEQVLLMSDHSCIVSDHAKLKSSSHRQTVSRYVRSSVESHEAHTRLGRGIVS